MYLLFVGDGGSPDNLAGGRWYGMGGLYILSDEWRSLSEQLAELKNRHGLVRHVKVEWGDLESAVAVKLGAAVIQPASEFYYLDHLSVEELEEFSREALSIVRSLSTACTIIVLCDKREAYRERSIVRAGRKDRQIGLIVRMCLQNLIQRFHHDLLASHANGMVVISSQVGGEPLSVSDIFEMLVSVDYDPFVRYDHLVETLCTVVPAYSAGVQAAELVCEAFLGCWVGTRLGKLAFGELTPTIRRGPGAKMAGYGVVGVPRKPSEEECRRRLGAGGD